MNIKIQIIYKWYDMWIGIYIDKKGRILYIFPIPTVGFKISY